MHYGLALHSEREGKKTQKQIMRANVANERNKFKSAFYFVFSLTLLVEYLHD